MKQNDSMKPGVLKSVATVVTLSVACMPFALAQTAVGPRIKTVKNVTCVRADDRQFLEFKPGAWVMKMGPNDRNPFYFKEVRRSKKSIFLENTKKPGLTAKLNIKKSKIKYYIPTVGPLYYIIRAYNVNNGMC